MKKHPITKHGADLLHHELNRLKYTDRPNVIQAISEARAHGDLSENAEYAAAKEKQSFIEGRIQEIEAKLSLADIIDPSSHADEGRVVFGTTVTLMNVDTDKTVCYQIVGDDEADLSHGKISFNSPVARALIGKSIDDEVEVKTPNGVRTYEVLEIDFDN